MLRTAAPRLSAHCRVVRGVLLDQPLVRQTRFRNGVRARRLPTIRSSDIYLQCVAECYHTVLRALARRGHQQN
jgi:hypothetical protein